MDGNRPTEANNEAALTATSIRVVLYNLTTKQSFLNLLKGKPLCFASVFRMLTIEIT